MNKSVRDFFNKKEELFLKKNPSQMLKQNNEKRSKLHFR